MREKPGYDNMTLGRRPDWEISCLIGDLDDDDASGKRPYRGRPVQRAVEG